MLRSVETQPYAKRFVRSPPRSVGHTSRESGKRASRRDALPRRDRARDAPRTPHSVSLCAARLDRRAGRSSERAPSGAFGLFFFFFFQSVPAHGGWPGPSSAAGVLFFFFFQSAPAHGGWPDRPTDRPTDRSIDRSVDPSVAGALFYFFKVRQLTAVGRARRSRECYF